MIPCCPICDGDMHFIPGSGYDYDVWLCDDPNCEGEIEIETSSAVENVETEKGG
jgi:hypothetical protein